MTPLSELALGQQFPAGALYIVATPIGNVADITVRALHVLGLVDRVAAEDTRNTSQLLSRYGISKPTIAVHEHNERSAAEHVIAHLRNGERIACVSDAGTPGISDPGAKLVDAVREAGFPVIPLPGASALTTAGASSDVLASDCGSSRMTSRILRSAGRACSRREVPVGLASVHTSSRPAATDGRI